MLTMLAAFGFSLPYSIASNVAKVWIEDNQKNKETHFHIKENILTVICGLVAGNPLFLFDITAMQIVMQVLLK